MNRRVNVCALRLGRWLIVGLALVFAAGCSEDDPIVIGTNKDAVVIRPGLNKDVYTDLIYGFKITNLPVDTWEVETRNKRTRLGDFGRGDDYLIERLTLRRPDENLCIIVSVEDLNDYRKTTPKSYWDDVVESYVLPEPDLQESIQSARGNSGAIIGYKGWWYAGMFVHGKRAYRIDLSPDKELEDERRVLQETDEHIETIRALMRHFEFI